MPLWPRAGMESYLPETPAFSTQHQGLCSLPPKPGGPPLLMMWLMQTSTSEACSFVSWWDVSPEVILPESSFKDDIGRWGQASMGEGMGMLQFKGNGPLPFPLFTGTWFIVFSSLILFVFHSQLLLCSQRNLMVIKQNAVFAVHLQLDSY